MKLLLDENLPHDFRQELSGHECITAAYAGYTGLENGQLLSRAAADSFEALLTMDTNLQYQQNHKNLSIAVVVLRAPSNDIDDLRPLRSALLNALKSLQPNAVTEIVRRLSRTDESD